MRRPCPSCGVVMQVRRDGRLRRHIDARTPVSFPRPLRICASSGAVVQ